MGHEHAMLLLRHFFNHPLYAAGLHLRELLPPHLFGHVACSATLSWALAATLYPPRPRLSPSFPSPLLLLILLLVPALLRFDYTNDYSIIELIV